MSTLYNNNKKIGFYQKGTFSIETLNGTLTFNSLSFSSPRLDSQRGRFSFIMVDQTVWVHRPPQLMFSITSSTLLHKLTYLRLKFQVFSFIFIFSLNTKVSSIPFKSETIKEITTRGNLQNQKTSKILSCFT